jgi:hypothetical protein
MKNMEWCCKQDLMEEDLMDKNMERRWKQDSMQVMDEIVVPFECDWSTSSLSLEK